MWNNGNQETTPIQTVSCRNKLHSKLAGLLSAVHERLNGKAVVIINSFIVCGAFCWTVVKAHKQKKHTLKMFWHPPQSPLWLVSRAVMSSCGWLELISSHKFTFPPLLIQRSHLFRLKTTWLSPCCNTDAQSTKYEWATPQDKKVRALNTLSPQYQESKEQSLLPSGRLNNR